MKWKLRLFMLKKLPLAFFAGLKYKSLDEDQCSITIKHSWINQNPFNSMYFAAMMMGSEMSTGLMSLEYLKLRKRSLSLLVVGCSATYKKKATGKITFQCTQVKELFEKLDALSQKGDSVVVPLHSIATDEQGDTVAEFTYQWSYLLKK